MRYLTIKNVEKYHPGYKDRELIWCKVYFKMINADPEFELLCEIDKWRFIAFIMLQLQTKKEIPIDERWLKRKGFDLKKRSISLTLQMLHKHIEVCNKSGADIKEDNKKVKEDDNVYKEWEKDVVSQWNKFCEKYPCLSKIKELSESRKKKLKLRFTRSNFRKFEDILVALAKQQFLLGENNRKWKIGFDWLIENDINYIKVLEEQYGDRKGIRGIDPKYLK